MAARPEEIVKDIEHDLDALRLMKIRKAFSVVLDVVGAAAAIYFINKARKTAQAAKISIDTFAMPAIAVIGFLTFAEVFNKFCDLTAIQVLERDLREVHKALTA